MKKYGTAMKYMSKLLLSTLMIILNQSMIHAETLHDMLSIAYKNDVNFRIIESQFESKVNDSTMTLRAFLPKIDLKLSTRFQSETSKLEFVPNIQYQMNLFHGFSDVIGLKILQHATLAEIAKYHIQEQKEFAELIKTYLDVIVKKERCNIIEGNLNLLKKQLNLIKSRYSVGHATLIDVAIVESQLVGAEANLHRAQIESSNASITFETRFGAPVPDSMEFPEISSEVLQDLYTKDLASVTKESNFDLLQNDYINRAKKAQVAQAELSRLPRIDASINSFILTGSNTQYSGGIELTLPLFGGGISDKARGARIDARASSYNFGLIQKFTEKTVNLSLQNLSSLEKSVKYTELLLKSQQLIVDSLNKKFLLANVDLDKILDAESKLNSTKQELWNIKSKFIISFYDLQSLIGQLTAKGLKLDVKYYDPDSEIKALKRKIFTTL